VSVIFLNVHVQTEDKIDVKDSFYEELTHVFDKFPNYHMTVLLGDFIAKVGREDIFKLTVGNESLHKISNGNGVRVVNFATSKNLTKVQYSIATFMNIFGHLQMGDPTVILTIT
jgi:hypothetical protein